MMQHWFSMLREYDAKPAEKRMGARGADEVFLSASGFKTAGGFFMGKGRTM
jgi:hypothetical protein